MDSLTAPIELIFLGTGTSSCLPHINCLTLPPGDKQCKTCLSAMTPAGKNNIRRNTSAVVRMNAWDGEKVTIVIDTGKTFQASALEWFPKYGLRKIDAVLITHGHADAINGLDDLRAWTLYGHIQAYIDVYLAQDTLEVIERSFPYLVSKELASGSGDVAEFRWHIISDQVPFEIGSTRIEVLPFAVRHGHIGSKISSSSGFQTPLTPPHVAQVTPPFSGTEELSKADNNSFLQEASPPKVFENESKQMFRPYLSFGFKIQEEIIYISDASFIPDDVYSRLVPDKGHRPIPVCVLDCLQLKPHVSHMHLSHSIAAARRFRAYRTYLIGFCHEASHEEYVNITSKIGGKIPDSKTLSQAEVDGIATIDEGELIWVRPAHDGLRVFIEAGVAVDETY
ncbi:beta-lactamase-like protein, partial [Mycena sanguinolenta]